MTMVTMGGDIGDHGGGGILVTLGVIGDHGGILVAMGGYFSYMYVQ